MHLYGNDLDEEHTAVESGLAWTVDCSDQDREFIGRETLEVQKTSGGKYTFTGVDGPCDVMIRDKLVAARSVKLPFIRNGQPTFT